MCGVRTAIRCVWNQYLSPQKNSIFGSFAELKQVSVAADEEISAVNALLQDGWRLLHVGHTNKHTIYVLGRPPQQSRRRTGFVA